jgi:hypothetical protein
MLSPWAIQFGDTLVDINDMSIDDYLPIAKRYGVNYLELAQSPGVEPRALRELIALGAKMAGVPEPEGIDKVGEIAPLLRMLVPVADSLPTEWANGNPQEAEQETT